MFYLYRFYNEIYHLKSPPTIATVQLPVIIRNLQNKTASLFSWHARPMALNFSNYLYKCERASCVSGAAGCPHERRKQHRRRVCGVFSTGSSFSEVHRTSVCPRGPIRPPWQPYSQTYTYLSAPPMILRMWLFAVRFCG